MLEVFSILVELIFAVGVVEAASIERLVEFFLELVGAGFDAFDDAINVGFGLDPAASFTWLRRSIGCQEQECCTNS